MRVIRPLGVYSASSHSKCYHEMNPLGCAKPYSAGLVWSILGEYRVVTQGKIRIKKGGR